MNRKYCFYGLSMQYLSLSVCVTRDFKRSHGIFQKVVGILHSSSDLIERGTQQIIFGKSRFYLILS